MGRAMTSRPVRFCLVVFLLLVGGAGAYVVFDGYERYVASLTTERSLVARFDGMLAEANDLALAQRGYFEPARENPSAPQFQQVRQLSDRLKAELAVLRSSISDPAMLEQIASFGTALDDFTATDTRVRTNLANDTLFSAADLVFSASTADLRSMADALAALKTLAEDPVEVARATLRRNALAATGVVGFVWIVGLLMLGWNPTRSVPASVGGVPSAPAAADVLDAASSQPVPGSVPEEAAPGVSEGAVPVEIIDLDAVAAVCGSMARAASATDLREIMADAAGCLDATGMIVWLGAGEELFPVLGHGYDPRMLARIGPLAREASNATATAWRTMALQVVPGEQGRTGAIVVPIVSGTGCIGVLSAEIGGGRERNDDLRSVLTVLAAQLSTIVAAWPEPSSATEESGLSQPGSIAVTL